MSRRFQGKVALVTGGASGIGHATALAFAREGARVVIADVSVESGEEVVRSIKESGSEAFFVKADVSKSAEVKALVDRTGEVYGRLDYAFNNAGTMGKGGTTVACTEDNFDRTVSINVKGVWLCMKYEIPQMLKQGKGVIVNTASIAGIGGTPNNPAYGASKAAVAHLTRSAALEYAKSGIRVNAVCPGFTRTPMVERLVNSGSFTESAMDAMHPIGRIGEPAEIAEAVVWLCSDAASFITGHSLYVDGGLAARCL